MVLMITVDVKTSSNFNSVEKIGENHYLVYVKEHPKKGKANRAVMKVLKDYFNRQVFLVTGHTSSRKTFEVFD
jgi:uncharacterized protein (TIGR00251 family)